ncbi:MAG: Serine-tRNA ligase [Candidatus Daviesbacteria bacterium GW2011_GWB1_39_5]|nr:MAG: Serine-tRNA ligase [Candidatus Daviesbacteria bacterium GW2011_GWB1_39_5]
MLDINYIRDNLEKVRKSIQARKAGVDLDQLLRLDESRRDLIQKVDALRAKRNEAAKAKDIEAGKKIKGELDSLEKQLGKTEKEWNSLMLQVPNILLDEVPIGDVSKNKTIEKVGELPEFSFKPKDHIELGKLLNIIDFERGVKTGGFRGYYLKNEGARLHWAVLQFAFERFSTCCAACNKQKICSCWRRPVSLGRRRYIQSFG